MSHAIKRFEVLDSWRGICALFVVLGHFLPYLRETGISFGSMASNSYVFVDFFFVLSGFVITRNYWTRIETKTQAFRFMMVRWGRVYPLHVFMLFLIIGLESSNPIGGADAMFSTQSKSVESLIGNLLLIHSMGVYPVLTWNFPSWSISVEFFSYLTFAVLLWVWGTRRMPIFAAVIMLIAPVLLWFIAGELGGKMESNITYDYGFLRCLGGFFAGVMVCKLFEKSENKLHQIGKMHATILEILMLISVVLFTSNVDNTYLSYASPLLFSVCVLVFSIEGGVVSTLLKTKPFLFLGALSYSLYMTHAFIQRVVVTGIDIIEKHVGLDMVKQGANNGDPTDIVLYFDVGIPTAVLLTGVMLVMVVFFSYITYNLIETPAYKWVKKCVRS